MLSSLNAPLSPAPGILLIILSTAVVSIYAFYHQKVYFSFILHPYSIVRKKKLYTLITAALVHTGWFHLAFNLAIIYILGSMVEHEFVRHHLFGHLQFVLLYIFSTVIGNFGSAFVHRKDFSFRSAGASTGALAILGSFCVINANESYISLPYLGSVLNIHFILIFILGLCSEIRFGKKDHIDQYAHLFGVLSGIIITILLYPDLLKLILLF
ncbi:rhomboid family intramembrane serine protease [Pedobacter caeni]|uniref:Rhomboid family protein n=1 Tax=Pedobacter caeni TaxID=288992 RepID=A0A1M5LIS0_9SPHI|nr:rhomboid family intramembrane serine protease [Pedobacter caeni]SHG65044.1 Rhomboid family protein [Pedobacter caeni]